MPWQPDRPASRHRLRGPLTPEMAAWLDASGADWWRESTSTISFADAADLDRFLEMWGTEAERIARRPPAEGSAEQAWSWASIGERLAQALALAERWAEQHPEDVRYVDIRGRVRLRCGDAAGAARDFERAIALRPDYGPLHDRLGDAYAALRRGDDARRAWQQALALVPADAAPEPDWDRRAVARKLTGGWPTLMPAAGAAGRLPTR